MKKSLAYVATAVVLGTALMLAPIWLFPAPMQYGVVPEQHNPLETLRGLSEKSEALAGISVNQPTDAISVSLILTVSLASALGAVLYHKKRMPSSPAV